MAKVVYKLDLVVSGSLESGSERVRIVYACKDSENADLVSLPKAVEMNMAQFMFGVASVLSPQQAVGLWYALINVAETAEGLPLSSAPDTPDWPNGAALTAESESPTSVTLAWPAAFSAQGVELYRVFKDGIQIAEVNGDVLEYTATGLEPATPYAFKVEASYNGNWTTDGPIAWVSTQSDDAAPTWDAGSALVASEVGPTSLNLQWPAAEDNVGVTNYRVKKDGAVLATVGPSTLTYAVTDLLPLTEYTFAVEACDGSNNWTENSLSLTLSTPLI